MPASHPDDHPATRRDLAQLREVVEANVRADLAELNAKVTEGFAKVERRFGQMEQRFARIDSRFAKVDSKIAHQTRVLVVLNILISSAMAGIIIRATS